MSDKKKEKSQDKHTEPQALVRRAAIQLAHESGEWICPEEQDLKEEKGVLHETVEEDQETKDLYTSFVRQATKFERLSEETERALGLKVRDYDDESAAKKLVIHNLRLAIKMAHQYRRSWTSLMDLVQEASTGMAIAAKKWDPDKGTRFGTYATYWIRAQLTKFLMTNARLIHTANTRAGRRVYFSLPQIRRRLLAEGKTPTVELIAKEVGEDPKEVANIMTRLSARETSLSTPIDESGAYTLQDALGSEDPDPERLVAKYQINKIMAGLIERFEKTIENERDLVIWRENLIANEAETLVALGQRFGVTKQRMGQLADRLKKSFRRHIIDELGPNTNLSWLFTDSR